MTVRYAEVAVLNGSPQHGSFTYAVPEGMALRRGMSVVVPWRTQWCAGIVIEVTDESEIAEPRPIDCVLDPEPVVTTRQLELASWISDRYLAPIAQCAVLFLPPGTPARPRRNPASFRPIIPAQPRVPKRLTLDISLRRLREVTQRWPMSKPSRQANLLLRLVNGPLPIDEAARVLGGSHPLDRWLASTSMAVREADLIRLDIPPQDAHSAADSLRRTSAERRQLALMRMLEGGDMDETQARRSTGATAADVDALEQMGYLQRLAESESPERPEAIPAPRLSERQQFAASEIASAIDADGGDTFVLHGVTGSGKTEVYLATTEHALDLGHGVVVLVPEIALAPQTIARFEARFPGQVAVRHSRLSARDAREQWRQVHAGEKRILIGARSALFGPMRSLALVILDEEHEWTYKQVDPQPRYHARTVAQEIARSWGIVTVLGSATPDLVTMADAYAGNSRLLTLPQRIQAGSDAPITIPPPTVDVVDMREELRAGIRSVFSRALDAAISDALIRDEQVLLFLNRRGMAALVCRACGNAVECERCAVAMTLHRPGPYLQCHECGLRQQAVRECPSCFDQRIGAMSFGTAQLESEVRRRWGDVSITRWDRDTSRTGGSHEALLREFAERRSQVLIGTQMIAKGLDLPSVTLAGVVNADLSLRESDYTASERTFQLLSQVAGRAGRGELGGRVIIQTYSPDHFAVTAAAAHDYEAFYRPEMDLRSRLDYPPYGRLARLMVSRSTESEADQEAERAARELSRLRATTPGAVAQVIGPAPANPARRRSQWRRQVVLKGEDPARLLAQIELRRGWSVDIDPVD
ncbi:MAG: primosomal protein N' [Chloroflexi bacterium]|nr:primosomal protein N' [Chloroflexota bacterium]